MPALEFGLPPHHGLSGGPQDLCQGRLLELPPSDGEVQQAWRLRLMGRGGRLLSLGWRRGLRILRRQQHLHVSLLSRGLLVHQGRLCLLERHHDILDACRGGLLRIHHRLGGDELWRGHTGYRRQLQPATGVHDWRSAHQRHAPQRHVVEPHRPDPAPQLADLQRGGRGAAEDPEDQGRAQAARGQRLRERRRGRRHGGGAQRRGGLLGRRVRQRHGRRVAHRPRRPSPGALRSRQRSWPAS
mmetsp:Transcript_103909/g.310354  ORF Transcript_103909/g.310354 Transcript_103909/m.310354 type:complete len:242 (-) Transcript_103909:39-764(-)